jgi:hypothetical protein
MTRRRLENLDWANTVLACIYTPLMILQLVLFLFFYYNHLGLDLLAYAGWFLWALSIIFGLLPIYEFRKKGRGTRNISLVCCSSSP